jgi:hypothetical protein
MTNGPSIQARGTLAPGDLYRFSVYSITVRLWWMSLIFGICFIYWATSYWFKLSEWEWNLPNVFGPLFLFVFMPYAFFVAPYFSAKKQVKKNPHFSGIATYTFSDRGLEMAGPHSQSQVDWSGIVRVRETSSLLLIYPQNAVAYVVPKRFFAGPGEVSQAREILRSYVKDARLKKAQ